MVKEIYRHLPPTPPQVLLSIEPMFRLLREEQLRDSEHLIAHLSTMLSVPKKTVYRWVEDGITLRNAEGLAYKIGLHPSYIWGPEYHIAVYMDELRESMISNSRSQRASIRRSIKRKEKREKISNGKA